MRVLSFDVGVRTLAFAIVSRSSNADVVRVHDFNVLDTLHAATKVRNARTLPADKCIMYMVDTLKEWDKCLFGDDTEPFEPYTRILIEQQPMFNPKMRQVSAGLLAYLYSRSNVPVEYVNASCKLKVTADATLDTLQASVPPATTEPAEDDDVVEEPVPTNISNRKKRQRENYVANKQYAVNICRAILTKNGDEFLYAKYASLNKQDDAADSILQGVYYCIAKSRGC